MSYWEKLNALKTDMNDSYDINPIRKALSESAIIIFKNINSYADSLNNVTAENRLNGTTDDVPAVDELKFNHTNKLLTIVDENREKVSSFISNKAGYMLDKLNNIYEAYKGCKYILTHINLYVTEEELQKLYPNKTIESLNVEMEKLFNELGKRREEMECLYKNTNIPDFNKEYTDDNVIEYLNILKHIAESINDTYNKVNGFIISTSNIFRSVYSLYTTAQKIEEPNKINLPVEEEKPEANIPVNECISVMELFSKANLLLENNVIKSKAAAINILLEDATEDEKNVKLSELRNIMHIDMWGNMKSMIRDLFDSTRISIINIKSSKTTSEYIKWLDKNYDKINELAKDPVKMGSYSYQYPNNLFEKPNFINIISTINTEANRIVPMIRFDNPNTDYSSKLKGVDDWFTGKKDEDIYSYLVNKVVGENSTIDDMFKSTSELSEHMSDPSKFMEVIDNSMATITEAILSFESMVNLSEFSYNKIKDTDEGDSDKFRYCRYRIMVMNTAIKIAMEILNAYIAFVVRNCKECYNILDGFIKKK